MPHPAPLALLLAAALALTACATPRQQCLAGATRDLSVVRDLIAEAQTNIARGYALRREPYTRIGTQFCYRGRGATNLGFCAVNETAIREVPEAIDLNAERAKLAGLQAKERELAAASTAQVRSCVARYPE